MGSGLWRSALFSILICVAWVSVPENELAAAASPKAQKETKARALSVMPESQPAAPRSVVKSRAKHRLKKETEHPMTAEFRQKKSSARLNSHSHLRKKTLHLTPPPEEVQLQPDQSHHGILENSRRYDPSPDQHKGAVPNPQARDLRFDHFQEVDKNQDGVIDPLERATSRLDIERDMNNYTWE